MDIAIVQTTGIASSSSLSGSNTLQTVAFGVPPTVGNTIVAWSWGYSDAHTGAAMPTFSDTGGNGYSTPDGAFQAVDNDAWCLIAYAPVVATGASFKVSVTMPTAPWGFGPGIVGAGEFSGIVTPYPLDGAVGSAPGTTAQSFAPGDLITSSGSLVAAVVAIDILGGNLAAPSGWSSAGRQMNGSTFQVGEGLYQVAPTSPANPTWTTTDAAGKWAAAPLALLTAAAGGGDGGGGGGGPVDSGGFGGSGLQRPVAEGWA